MYTHGLKAGEYRIFGEGHCVDFGRFVVEFIAEHFAEWRQRNELPIIFVERSGDGVAVDKVFVSFIVGEKAHQRGEAGAAHGVYLHFGVEARELVCEFVHAHNAAWHVAADGCDGVFLEKLGIGGIHAGCNALLFGHAE